ncbi:hypothetical protein GUJ93_ZPchr0006g45327 [Zizania palustris]|uniref:O-methyltransferase C-terminal domain-containing protein n=1 Tax=Zizania palustris TaxID=103762 RepID=A0A8J5T6T4_ZIZPA|nr:hypothetical protein GUJ93_ZPchr0006g45327 [Zizania palustris]
MHVQWILLMLSDEDCVKILKNCHKALPEDGKVIIVNGILPEHPDTTPTAQDSFGLDICMLLLHSGGRQRTEKEFAKLAKDSGFTGVVRTTYIFLNFYALEFTK